ncbi:CreA family protein [Saccharopolyspora karakumensis]|uniref:CreA family protein n=1 Tax=Saccharopolyspora karakumensis TaxID=2530386 RepID=UPI001404DC80|nr:CreA family protein [Saccharopolyspora karakumensis]
MPEPLTKDQKVVFRRKTTVFFAGELRHGVDANRKTLKFTKKIWRGFAWQRAILIPAGRQRSRKGKNHEHPRAGEEGR